jgi:hypothetical protein
MGVCLQMIQCLGAMIAPVLPHASREIARALGLGENAFAKIESALESRWSYTLEGETPKLFMRVSLPTDAEAEAAAEPAKKK